MPPTIIHGKISTISFSIYLFHSLLNAFVIFLFRDAFLHLKDVARYAGFMLESFLKQLIKCIIYICCINVTTF